MAARTVTEDWRSVKEVSERQLRQSDELGIHLNTFLTETKDFTGHTNRSPGRVHRAVHSPVPRIPAQDHGKVMKVTPLANAIKNSGVLGSTNMTPSVPPPKIQRTPVFSPMRSPSSRVRREKFFRLKKESKWSGILNRDFYGVREVIENERYFGTNSGLLDMKDSRPSRGGKKTIQYMPTATELDSEAMTARPRLLYLVRKFDKRQWPSHSYPGTLAMGMVFQDGDDIATVWERKAGNAELLSALNGTQPYYTKISTAHAMLDAQGAFPMDDLSASAPLPALTPLSHTQRNVRRPKGGLFSTSFPTIDNYRITQPHKSRSPSRQQKQQHDHQWGSPSDSDMQTMRLASGRPHRQEEPPAQEPNTPSSSSIINRPPPYVYRPTVSYIQVQGQHPTPDTVLHGGRMRGSTRVCAAWLNPQVIETSLGKKTIRDLKTYYPSHETPEPDEAMSGWSLEPLLNKQNGRGSIPAAYILDSHSKALDTNQDEHQSPSEGMRPVQHHTYYNYPHEPDLHNVRPSRESDKRLMDVSPYRSPRLGLQSIELEPVDREGALNVAQATMSPRDMKPILSPREVALKSTRISERTLSKESNRVPSNQSNRMPSNQSNRVPSDQSNRVPSNQTNRAVSNQSVKGGSQSARSGVSPKSPNKSPKHRNVSPAKEASVDEFCASKDGLIGWSETD